MSRYIEQEVSDIIRNPREGKTVTLLLGVSADMDSVREQLQAIGAEPERLPYDTLRVEVPEADVSLVCDIDGLKSVEVEGTIETLESGNSDYPVEICSTVVGRHRHSVVNIEHLRCNSSSTAHEGVPLTLSSLTHTA